MSALLDDIRHAFRNIRRAPGFNGIVVMTLAVGIGGTTALFSIVKTVLLDPLPYPHSERLVAVARYPWIPAEIVLDLEGSSSFDDLAAYYPQPFAVTGGVEPLEMEGAQVTPGFFRLFRATMERGRPFLPADARAGAAPVAVLSHDTWQRLYGGREVLGRTIRVNGLVHEVVGVAPPEFQQFAPRSRDPAVWVPFRLTTLAADGRTSYVIPLARLAPGVSLSRAQAELAAATSRFRQAHPDVQGPASRPLHWATVKSQLVGDVRTALLVLQLAVGVLLLIGCVNVANLLLARFSARQGELAVRSAMGASRQRLVRQLLTESVVLALLGGMAGLLLMLAGIRLLLTLAPQDIPRIGDVSGDVPVFLFALAVSVLAGLAFGTAPALAAGHHAPSDVLKEGGRTAARSRRQRRLSRALVVAEVSLTFVLLVGAGLLGRTLLSLTRQAPGFRTSDVLALTMHVPGNRYPSVPQLEAFYRRTLERLRDVPGAVSVAVANNLPISRGHATREYVVEGATDAKPRLAQYGVVSPGYFRTLDIPLLRGRTFRDTDRRGAVRVAVVDQAFARAAWPGQDPIGRRFRFEDDRDAWLTVVGVTGDIRGNGLASDPRPGFYVSYQQRPVSPAELAVGHDVVWLVRPAAAGMANALRRAIHSVDAGQPVTDVAALDGIVARGVRPQRFRAALLGIFAGMALLLVIAGIYGVVGYVVAERTREFGIRLALGATRTDLVRIVLGWGVRLTAFGTILGLAGVYAVNRYLASLLFGVTPTDRLTLAASVSLVLLITLAACLAPAVHATRLDPARTLRAERTQDT